MFKMLVVLILMLMSIMGAKADYVDENGDKLVVIPGEYIAVLNIVAPFKVAPNKAGSVKEQMTSVIRQLVNEYAIVTVKPLVVGGYQSLWIRGEHSNVQEATFKLSVIRYIEQNKYINVSYCSNQTTSAGTWGLDRIDQRNKVSKTGSGSYGYAGPLSSEPPSDLDVYVVDTGIRVDHQEFGGRAIWGYTAAGINGGDRDGNGHGTHAAGIVGSTTYGVAKDVRLVAVKVLNDSGFGSLASVIDGINWVFNDHMSKNGKGKHKAIMNLSFSGRGKSKVLETCLTVTIDAGVITVVSAGNGDRDACEYSPARTTKATTVGATDPDDKVAKFSGGGSNWGKCLDIWAPGKDILSTSHLSTTATSIKSGTSVAAPHVTGVIAEWVKSMDTPPNHLAVELWLRLTASSHNRTTFQNENEASSYNGMIYARCGGCVNLPGIIITLGTSFSSLIRL